MSINRPIGPWSSAYFFVESLVPFEPQTGPLDASALFLIGSGRSFTSSRSRSIRLRRARTRSLDGARFRSQRERCSRSWSASGATSVATDDGRRYLVASFTSALLYSSPNLWRQFRGGAGGTRAVASALRPGSPAPRAHVVVVPTVVVFFGGTRDRTPSGDRAPNELDGTTVCTRYIASGGSPFASGNAERIAFGDSRFGER